MLAALIAAPVAVEVALLGADHGLWGHVNWRWLAYQDGAFWGDVLRGEPAAFAAQPVTMMVSYAFLHSGVLHLAGNMLTLAMIGPRVADHLGPWWLLFLYLLTTVGGALAFALSDTPVPMVGASGAVFGLMGALIAWDHLVRRRLGQPSRWAALILQLVVLNIVLWLASGGMLAWQTHLGGFVAGVAFALVDTRLRSRVRVRL